MAHTNLNLVDCADPFVIASRIVDTIGADNIVALVSFLGRTGGLGHLVHDLGIATGGTARDKGRARVLVMGASMLPLGKMRSLVRKAGYDQDRFDYRLDYDKLDNRSISSLRGSSYDAVIVGPMHHSIDGMHDASSAIEHMRRHPDEFPPVIEACDASGLKITRTSFKAALDELDLIYAA